jgi:hypothetical protein
MLRLNPEDGSIEPLWPAGGIPQSQLFDVAVVPDG